MAMVGSERIEETMDPELIAERFVLAYEKKGYTREWINQRLMAISARKAVIYKNTYLSTFFEKADKKPIYEDKKIFGGVMYGNFLLCCSKYRW